jgi:hypothetical protein
MDIGELGIFLADSQIDLEPDIAEKLLQVSCQECNVDTVIEAGDEALDLTSFLAFLIRLAIEPGLKVSKDGDTEYIVATVLTQIVQNHVCSRAIRLVILNPNVVILSFPTNFTFIPGTREFRKFRQAQSYREGFVFQAQALPGRNILLFCQRR